MHNTSILRASGAACFAAALAFALPVPDSVRIQFQGTGHPNIASARPRMQSSVTVDVAGERWLLDAGAGAVARLYENGKAPDTLRHIFVSHLHYDHCVDLDAVIWQWRSLGSGPLGRRGKDAGRRLNLCGPDGLEEMLSDLYNRAYKVDGRGKALLTNPAIERNTNREAGGFEAEGYNVSFTEVVHGEGAMDSWAIRFETPKGVLVYSGDIGSPRHLEAREQQGLIELAKGADMLVLDTLHLPPEELEKIVEATGAKTVVFTHLTERPIGFARYYDLDKTVSLAERHAERVVVAQDGLELEL